MAFSFIQLTQNSVTASAAGTVVSPNFAANPTAGNLIWAAAFYDGNGVASLTGLNIVLTDTLGNTYTLLKNIDDTTNGYRVGIYYAKNITGGGANAITATYNTPPSGSFYKGVVGAEYSGFDTVAPFTTGEQAGQEQASVGTGTDAVTSGATPGLSTQPCGVIGFTSILHSTNGPAAAGTGYTSRGAFWTFGTGGTFATLEDKRVTSTSAVTATFTAPNAAASWATSVVVFKEVFVPASLSAGAIVYAYAVEPAVLGTFILSAAAITYSYVVESDTLSSSGQSFSMLVAPLSYTLSLPDSSSDLQLDVSAITYSYIELNVNLIGPAGARSVGVSSRGVSSNEKAAVSSTVVSGPGVTRDPGVSESLP